MTRLLSIAIVLFSSVTPTFAQAPAPREAVADAPEKLLAPTSQFFIRWDGIASHNQAYKNSFWGDVMAGPTGGSIRSLLAELPKQLGHNLLVEPLLQGKSPEDLKKAFADFKSGSTIVDLIRDKGVLIGVEVREPKLTLKGFGQAIGSLVQGELPDSGLVSPDVRVIVIVPNVGDQAQAIQAALQLIVTKEVASEPFEVAGRNGQVLASTAETDSKRLTVTWLEGQHFVICVGNAKAKEVVEGVMANARAGGLTGHPLFQKCAQNPGYESVARGFIDTARLIAMAKTLAGPFVPGLAPRLDDLGLGNLQSIVFNSGFNGKESRGTYEFELPGKRKGLTKIVKGTPIGLKDLPPLPPDMTRFSALRIEPTAAYDAAIIAIESLLSSVQLGPEDDGQEIGVADKIRLRREFLRSQVDRMLGIKLENSLLPQLGDKFVMYNSPSEGISALGTVFCLSLKDPATFKVAMDRIHRGVEGSGGIPVRVRKKILCGIEIREFYSKSFLFLTPTYTIVGDWLVFSLHPQPVQGFVLRSSGELPVWKPDASTAARMAKLPADACGLQYCDPRSTVQNLCSIGPVALNVLNSFSLTSSNDDPTSYEPIDIGLIPNAHELSKHLFPNLTVTRDDGKSIRIELNESLSLPFEAFGIESTVVGGGALIYFFLGFAF